MSQLHICNTFFEMELKSPNRKPLIDWLRSHPVVLQLQFLPLLYAKPNDKILVSDLPENPDPRLCLTAPPDATQIEHWGPSLSIASSVKIPYKIPEWDLICKINSKIFSFTESPKLPGAQLLETTSEINAWINKTPDPKVLKTPFGTAGNGHILNPNVKQLYIGPLIGEPWVERVLDFSTQWDDGRLVGVTIFKNEANGTYKGTFEGDVDPSILNDHLAIAKPIVEKIKYLGYSGNLGIDSFVYLWNGEKRLHPIVEINARKTMSWVALQTPTKRLYYSHSQNGRLPTQLNVKGKTINFSRNIICT